MSSLQSILAFLAPFEDLLKPEVMQLEASAVAELNTVVGNVSSPDLKLLLQSLAGAVDSFAKVEITKI